MKATQTQMECIDGLHKVMNTFGGANVHISIADSIKRMGMAIGVRIRSCSYNEQDNTVMLYVA